MKFLIIKTSSFGDIIHVFPVVEWIKQKFPQSQIDWVVEAPFAELLEAHSGINRIYRVETKQWRKGKNLKSFFEIRKCLKQTTYDVLFDLQGNTKSGFFSFLARAKKKVGFGWKSIPEWPNLLFTNQKVNPPFGNNIRQDYLYLVQNSFADYSPCQETRTLLHISSERRDWIRGLLKDPRLSRRPRIMVCPGSAWPNKRMSTTELQKWLDALWRKYACSFLFIWGNTEELREIEKLQLGFKESSLVIGKLSIPVLQNLMDQMDLVIAMDSLPLHLAATTHVGTFGVFGASSANKYQPFGKYHQSFQATCPYKIMFEKRCPKLRTCKTGACIRSLDGTLLQTEFSFLNEFIGK